MTVYEHYEKRIKDLQQMVKDRDVEIERLDKAFRKKVKRMSSRHDAITFKLEKKIEELTK